MHLFFYIYSYIHTYIFFSHNKHLPIMNSSQTQYATIYCAIWPQRPLLSLYRSPFVCLFIVLSPLIHLNPQTLFGAYKKHIFHLTADIINPLLGQAPNHSHRKKETKSHLILKIHKKNSEKVHEKKIRPSFCFFFFFVFNYVSENTQSFERFIWQTPYVPPRTALFGNHQITSTRKSYEKKNIFMTAAN